MRLLTSEEMRAADKYSIEQMGISSLVLMENAGIKSLLSIEKILNGLSDKRFTIVCGKGCNGGDGFVIARHLFNNRIAAHVFCTSPLEQLCPDAKTNCEIFIKSGGQVVFLNELQDLSKLVFAMEFTECLIDCVLGTGVKGNIRGLAAEVVSAMNRTRAVKIAIDLPSGLNGSTGEVSTPCFNADYTLTLGAPKLGLFLQPAKSFAGEVWLSDIGLPEKALASVGSKVSLLTSEVCANSLKPRFDTMHKSDAGKALIIAGSKEYPGAPVMASYGAMRSGAGIVRLLLPDCLKECMPFQLLPETIVNFIQSKDGGFDISEDTVNLYSGKYGCLLIGPGWGVNKAQKKSLNSILSCWAGSLVIDADALNMITDLTALKASKASIAVTPHIGEMARLTHKSIEEIKTNQVGAAVEFAKQNHITVVLKSSTTVIADYNENALVCSRENSALARGGSGDLLAGLICGLASAPGQSLAKAAAAGVWLHSEAAEIARAKFGADAATISETAALIPEAFKKIRA